MALVLHSAASPDSVGLQGIGSAAGRGFSLIVSLMMLIVIIILGLSASQMAINEERGSRNDRDRQLAFQAAEAALKDAEREIYGATSPLCSVAGQLNRGRMRAGTSTCFNSDNYFGYAVGCSTPPNAGLCTYVPMSAACLPPYAPPFAAGACPAYLVSSVDFYKDATGSGNNNTVAYGTYTLQRYGSQRDASGAATGIGIGTPVSIYPPRYIIERVPKNTSVDSLTMAGSGGGLGGGEMFRVTAMGFGANPNSQVVLQSVVSTQD